MRPLTRHLDGASKKLSCGLQNVAAPACKLAQNPNAATTDGSLETGLAIYFGSPDSLSQLLGAGTPRSPRKTGLKQSPRSKRRLGAALTYSRNPGFTETRLRPLARRREMTARPPWVFIRVRKPCTFDRRRRFGWNVRFGMKSLLCSCP